MIPTKDYQSYLKANSTLFDLIDNHAPILHDRFHDVIVVLNFICSLEEQNEIIEEEYEVIFESGFSYLHEQLETIKIYYKNYFRENDEDLIKYQTVINYILFLDDLTEALSEKNMLSDEVNNVFTELGKKLENILINKEKFNDEDIDNINATVDSYISHTDDVFTTDYIFSLIVDELEKYVLK